MKKTASEQNMKLNNDDDTLVKAGETIYDALEERGLFYSHGHSSTIGTHLVDTGHLGLVRDSGKFYFLRPGYYTFLNPKTHYMGDVSITAPVIELKDTSESKAE